MNRMTIGLGAAVLALLSQGAVAGCGDVSRTQFEAAANTAAIETDGFGFGLPMWAKEAKGQNRAMTRSRFICAI